MSPRKSTSYLLLLAASLAGTALFQGALRREREALELSSRPDAPGLSGGEEAPQVVLASAGLGVFRALAIDFFWLRALRLGEEGQYFDAALLGRIITRLEPRIPRVWNFQAFNLSYNVSASLPPRERYPWVLEGLELLRDEALRFNPRSALIHMDLSFLFQHKIGLDFDAAGYLYRSELAAAFEVARESPEGREIYRKWKLDPGRLLKLEKKHAVELDFRAPESHALYWAEEGLELAPMDSSPRYVEKQLRHVISASILQLFSGGRPLKPRVGRIYSFIPDLRFLEKARSVLENELEGMIPSRKDGKANADLEDAYLQYLEKALSYLFLFGRGEEAEALLRSKKDHFPAGTTLKDVLAKTLFPQALEGGKEAFLEALAGALEPCVLLEAQASGVERLQAGFRALAGVIRELAIARLGEGSLAPLDDYLVLAIERRRERWEKSSLTLPLSERLKKWAEAQALPVGSGAQGLLLPEPAELLFRLDRLDPLEELRDGR